MENNQTKKSGSGRYFLLFFAVAFYSCCSLCNKFASAYPLLSWEFILLYGCSLSILMIYAVIWQQVLKRFELSVAYAAKPFSTIMSMIWGVALFHEAITWNMILGAAIILLGMKVVVRDHG